ncbi:hypothetical protein TCAL_05921, partial [Tigriopus californicus]|eukprot:TCALIF_05921-PA protein Name:"Protein of unknown function" AED:0.32 eAED:0.32 QI:0/0.5/0/0.66/1/0.66/3/0/760
MSQQLVSSWTIQFQIFVAGLCLACAQQGRNELVFSDDLPAYIPSQNKDQNFALNSILPQVNFGFAIRPTSTSNFAIVNQSPIVSAQIQNLNQDNFPKGVSLEPPSASISPTRATIAFGFSDQISVQDDQPAFSGRPGAEVLQLESSSSNFGSIPSNQNTLPINQNTVPINQNTVPINQNTVPINQNTVPINQNIVPTIEQPFSNSIIDLQSGEPPSFQQLTPFSQFGFSNIVSESSIVNPFLGQNGEFSQSSPPTTSATTPPDNVQFGLTNTRPIQTVPTQTISPTNQGVQTSLPSLGNSNGPVIFNPPSLISDGQDDNLRLNQGIDPFSQASISPSTFTSIVPPLIQNLQPTIDVGSTFANNPADGQVIQTLQQSSSNIRTDGAPQPSLQQPNAINQPEDITGQQPVEPLNPNIQTDDGAGQEPNILLPVAVVPPPVVPTGPQQQGIPVNLNQLPTPTPPPAPLVQAPQPDLSSDDCLERVCDQIITGRDLTYERALEILQDEEYLDATDFDVVRRHRRFKRRSEERKKPKTLSRKTRQVCGFFNSCATNQIAQSSAASPVTTTCPSSSSCQRKRKKRQVCELVASLPVTSANDCLVLGVAGGVASAAAIAVGVRPNAPPPPPPAPIAPQPVVQPLRIVNAIDVFPELGLAPRGVPQPGQFGGGALPFVTDGASAESLGLVPDGLVPVAIFPPFQNARTRADAVGVIFSETDDQSITVAGFDPADQVDFLNRRQPRFKRGIVQSLRHSVMSGLGRLRHQ